MELGGKMWPRTADTGAPCHRSTVAARTGARNTWSPGRIKATEPGPEKRRSFFFVQTLCSGTITVLQLRKWREREREKKKRIVSWLIFYLLTCCDRAVMFRRSGNNVPKLEIHVNAL